MLDRPRSLSVETVFVGSAPPTKGGCASIPDVPANHVAVILHTSGSTGEPQAHEKTWGQMVTGANRWRDRFAFDASDYIVPTIPAQHMFGFEASIMLPLQTGASVFRSQPLYPADIARALGLASNATLVTTPIHLRACGRSEIEWPPIRRVICSTASLDAQLAEECEATMRTRISEIFGSTETGAIASRRTVTDDHWHCLNGLTIEQRGADAYIRYSTTGERSRLDDEIEIIENHSFSLLGRPSDMIKIAGKRASMADLSHRLNRIEGIDDGVLLCRETPGDSVDRLIALVVAPTLSSRQIRVALARQIDSAFLPRRINPRRQAAAQCVRKAFSRRHTHPARPAERLLTKTTKKLRIEAEHPALAGHFPGDQLVPASVLLEAFLDAIRELYPDCRVAKLQHAKFFSPLRPDQDATIEIEAQDRLIQFRCWRATDIIANGTFILVPED